ncbi:MAG: hypothetical protein AAGK97_09440, partial [Bacteroidota bacterium]
MCQHQDYAYYLKSLPYLHRGQFIEWKILIDKAVAFNPAVYLSQRAWARFDYLRDYKGTLEDIQKLDSIFTGDLGYVASGIYHINIVKALCYKELGDTNAAIYTIIEQLNEKD